MTTTEIISKTIKDIDYLSICKNITGNHYLSDDLYQHCIMESMKINNERLNGLYERKELKYYLIYIIKVQWNNLKSSFNVSNRSFELKKNYSFNDKVSIIDKTIKYEKISGDTLDSKELNEYITEIDDILNNESYWRDGGIYDYYNREIFMMYYKLGNYNMVDGIHRDKTCKKLTSSTRKIEKLTSTKDSKGINHVSISKTIKETTEYIRSILKEKNII